ncbi:MAG TPA: hypothetical protein VIU45_00360 [Chitinophagaceae bacterium]
MKNKISLILICSVALIVSCSKQPYFNIPTDANGKVILTGIATATSAGISTLDDNFTVNATLPNAKAGDVMTVELLKPQVPPGGGAAQLLPLAGTQKQVTVASNLTVSVNFTRTQAMMNVPGDFVTVTFAGKTESASLVVTLKQATTVSNPEYGGNSVNVIRGAGTAFFDVSVQPKLSAYTGMVIVKRKNGINDPWVNVGSFASPSKVPVSGDDFAAGKDTMYYSFVSAVNTFTDSINMQVIDNDPYFFFKKSGTMTLGGSTAGLNLFVNGGLAANDANAIIAITGGSLTMHAGSAWAVNGKSISFVPSTMALYNQNNPNNAMTAFMAGTPSATADPASGEGVYIFKIVNGPNASDVFYGMLKIGSIVPGASISYEYRIGNTYAQLSVIH